MKGNAMSKRQASKSNNARLNNLDDTLKVMLPDYEITNYETRQKFPGSDCLYIRLRRLHKPVQLTVA